MCENSIGVRATKACSGFSLVETLVGLSLLGVVLIPALFLSSSYFLNQLSRTRQGMEVGHNVSQFLNRFTEELYLANWIMNSGSTKSDATHLYFAYYDTTAQREIKAGYQLTASGSNRILERLVYNENTQKWEILSPYSEIDAQTLLLPSTTVFTYCLDSETTCTTTSSPEKALLVRLKNWSFKNATNTQALALPDVDVYIAAGASGGDGALLSEAPRLMYTINAADALGAADIKLVSLSPFTGELNGTSIPSSSLTTVFTGELPGYYSMLVAPDGRLFIDNWGEYMTWHPSTGLTTLGLGDGWLNSSRVSSDGRVYFSEYTSSGKFWTWDKSTGLTTLLKNVDHPGDQSTTIAPDGRVYIGASKGYVWTWKPGQASVTTIFLGATSYAWDAPAQPDAFLISPIDGRVYFRAQDTASPYKYSIFTWLPSAGVTTASVIMGNLADNFQYTAMAVNPATGGLYFGDGKTGNSRLYYWNPSTGTTTLVNTGANSYSVGMYGLAVAPDGRVYFGEAYGNGSNPKLWTWKPGTTFTLLFSSGADHIAVLGENNGNFFFADQNKLYWGNISTPGVNTVIMTGTNPGHEDLVDNIWGAKNPFLIRDDGRIFFTDARSGSSSMWTWKSDTGLSTLYTSAGGHPGHAGSMVLDDNGRFYFTGRSESLGGSTSNAEPMFTWHETTGLSTIMGPNKDVFGTYGTMAAIPGSPGGVYFQAQGGMSYGYPVWRWVPGLSSSQISGSAVGAPNSNNITLTMAGGSYQASAQDSSGYIYYLDSTNKTIDAYKSATTNGKTSYTRVSSFGWGSWTTSPTAIAVDESSTGIALLDSANKRIDIYPNRLANGSSSAPTSFSVSSKAALPTGLAISNRTGNYLVLDSTVKGTNPNKYVTLYIFAGSNKAFLRSYDIVVGTGGLSPDDASAENNFKIALDNRRNILYLISPSLGKIFALSMPEYL
jgi:hypothetical protein